MAPLFLIGMMGAGKTSVGQLLARSLGAPFLDLDQHIELTLGTTIAQLCQQHGEAFFRKCEREALQSLVADPDFVRAAVVVATGGGIVCDPDNLRMMSSVGKLVYLEVDVATLCERLSTPAQRNARPLLGPETTLAARVSELLDMREPSYRQATLIVDGRGSPEQVVARVLQEI
jgi:shikimate kinase